MPNSIGKPYEVFDGQDHEGAAHWRQSEDDIFLFRESKQIDPQNDADHHAEGLTEAHVLPDGASDDGSASIPKAEIYEDRSTRIGNNFLRREIHETVTLDSSPATSNEAPAADTIAFGHTAAVSDADTTVLRDAGDKTRLEATILPDSADIFSRAMDSGHETDPTDVFTRLKGSDTSRMDEPADRTPESPDSRWHPDVMRDHSHIEADHVTGIETESPRNSDGISALESPEAASKVLEQEINALIEEMRRPDNRITVYEDPDDPDRFEWNALSAEEQARFRAIGDACADSANHLLTFVGERIELQRNTAAADARHTISDDSATREPVHLQMSHVINQQAIILTASVEAAEHQAEILSGDSFSLPDTWPYPKDHINDVTVRVRWPAISRNNSDRFPSIKFIESTYTFRTAGDGVYFAMGQSYRKEDMSPSDPAEVAAMYEAHFASAAPEVSMATTNLHLHQALFDGINARNTMISLEHLLQSGTQLYGSLEGTPENEMEPQRQDGAVGKNRSRTESLVSRAKYAGSSVVKMVQDSSGGRNRFYIPFG